MFLIDFFQITFKYLFSAFDVKESLIYVSVALSSFISLILTLAYFSNTSLRILKWVISVYFFITLAESIEYYLLQFSIFRPVALVIFVFFISFIFLFIQFKWSKVIKRTITIFCVVSALVSYEFLKGPGSTWGNTNLIVGIFILVHLLPTLMSLTLSSNDDRFMGTSKLMTGLISILTCIFIGYRYNDWTGKEEIYLRSVVVFINIIFMIEGFLLLKTKRKQN